MGSGWRAPPPPCPDTPSTAEMDFAKGLQKIVQNCRQSVTQEVGNLGGCVGGWGTRQCSSGLDVSLNTSRMDQRKGVSSLYKGG